MTRQPCCEPVGGMEIADRLGVQRRTVAVWKQRRLLPPGRWTVSGEDAWDWDTIREWAERTGRLSPNRRTEQS